MRELSCSLCSCGTLDFAECRSGLESASQKTKYYCTSVISELTPYVQRDGAMVIARLVEVRCKDWANGQGRGRVLRAEVVDGSGDLQISCFNGADALFDRLVQGVVYR